MKSPRIFSWGARTLVPLVLAATLISCASHRPGDPLVISVAATDTTGDHLPLAIKSEPHPLDRPRYGPPPPGYRRIVGEPVPDWHWGMAHPESTCRVSWRFLGPRPITGEAWSGNSNASGRVVSIAPHPTDPATVYIASASGGIWKTTNTGALWTPMTDELSILNHGVVTLDPQNPEVVYAGTGEYTTGSTGDGVFRSLDGGATWTRIATTSQVGNNCSGLIVSPTNSNVIHVTSSAGYTHSNDGGITWSRRFNGNVSSLAVNPISPNIVYIGVHGNGIYRSTDGGTTFSQLSGGLPTSGLRRIVLAICESQPQVLYAAIINSSGGLLGFYRTGDSGNTWVERTSTPNFPSPQGWYDVFVGVDPTNPNLVLCGGVDPRYAPAGVIRSTNAGNTWTEISNSGGQLHPDHHAIAWGPTGILWVANDGGVWRSNSRQGGGWINCNATLAVTQNYNVAVSPFNSNRLMMGTQDNGNIERQTDSYAWPQLLGGDGGFLAYDFDTQSRQYLCYVYLSVYRFVNGVNNGNISGPWSNDSRAFIAPLVMDPNNARSLLGGTNRIWRTLNAATGSPTWTAISTNTVGGGGVMTAIAVAMGASDTIYTGNSRGTIYVTTNASNWSQRISGLPGSGAGAVSDIFIDPTNPATAYCTIERTGGTRVFRTTNYGVQWVSVTGNLPGGVVPRALEVDWRFDPPHLYVGSGSGVWQSCDGGATWVKDGDDLPNVNVGDLAIDRARNTITVATYGRGAWRADLPNPCPADLSGSSDPNSPLYGMPDGVVDSADFFFFLDRFEAGDLARVDMSGSSDPADPSYGVPDGRLDAADFFFYLDLFVAGCP
ncbi:MAG: hypothetical protein KF866_10380 [Phycisphaeraceae bacterium]|nr:hypothetical protein [Phycisphaeraceae bacterium]MCW5754908.1 hypothetical protein [Phycisphaeraceae bacterium]